MYLKCYGSVTVNQCPDMHDLAPRYECGYVVHSLMPTVFSLCSSRVSFCSPGESTVLVSEKITFSH